MAELSGDPNVIADTGVSFLIWWLMVSAYRSIARSPDHEEKNKMDLGHGLPFILGLGIFGNIGQYNLRWSEAFSLGNDYRANLALNPYQSFFSSLKFRNSLYNAGCGKKSLSGAQTIFWISRRFTESEL